MHANYKFRPVTALLSVNYFDRFLSSHFLPVILILLFLHFPEKMPCYPGKEKRELMNFNKVLNFFFCCWWFVARKWVAASATVSCVLVFSGENGRNPSAPVIGSSNIWPEIRIWTQNRSKNGAPSDVRSQLETQFHHPVWLSSLLHLKTTRFQLRTRVVYPIFMVLVGSHYQNHPWYIHWPEYDHFYSFFVFFWGINFYFLKNFVVVNFLGFAPSTIAAAAVLCAAGESLDSPAICHQRLNEVCFHGLSGNLYFWGIVVEI